MYFNKKFHIKRVRTLLVKTPPSPYPHRTLSYAFFRPPLPPLVRAYFVNGPLPEKRIKFLVYKNIFLIFRASGTDFEKTTGFGYEQEKNLAGIGLTGI